MTPHHPNLIEWIVWIGWIIMVVTSPKWYLQLCKFLGVKH